MKDTLIFASILIAWVALNGWVLPYFGVQTCMSGACRPVPGTGGSEQKISVDEAKSVNSEDGESHPTDKSALSTDNLRIR